MAKEWSSPYHRPSDLHCRTAAWFRLGSEGKGVFGIHISRNSHLLLIPVVAYVEASI